MSYRAVLFDFDGTLADTAGDISASVNHALMVRYGEGNSIDLEQCRRTVGNGLRNELKASCEHLGLPFDDKTLDESLVVLEAYYSEHPCDHTTAYPGIERLLDSCSERSLILGVFSNKAQALLEKVVPMVFPRARFSYICGLRKDLPRKPDPAGILLFLNELGLGKDEVLYVGDSEVDWTVGNRAGVDTAIVTWGFRSRERLLGCGVSPAALIDIPEQLEQLIRR